MFFVSISMRMHFTDSFDECFVLWVNQIGVEFCCKLRLCVFVASSLFIMFWPYLNEFWSIGDALCLHFNESEFS